MGIRLITVARPPLLNRLAKTRLDSGRLESLSVCSAVKKIRAFGISVGFCPPHQRQQLAAYRDKLSSFIL